jgi:hypothetical protein
MTKYGGFTKQTKRIKAFNKTIFSKVKPTVAVIPASLLVIPAKAGIQTKTLRTIGRSALRATWIPAYAGMTAFVGLSR